MTSLKINLLTSRIRKSSVVGWESRLAVVHRVSSWCDRSRKVTALGDRFGIYFSSFSFVFHGFLVGHYDCRLKFYGGIKELIGRRVIIL